MSIHGDADKLNGVHRDLLLRLARWSETERALRGSRTLSEVDSHITGQHDMLMVCIKQIERILESNDLERWGNADC